MEGGTGGVIRGGFFWHKNELSPGGWGHRAHIEFATLITQGVLLVHPGVVLEPGAGGTALFFFFFGGS